ncbi:MAG TPA: hypothetical protein VFR15_16675 [Chloroflexia bacterium]|nr:hypothetical protein [Chloroflexia bacterium]
MILPELFKPANWHFALYSLRTVRRSARVAAYILRATIHLARTYNRD